MLQIISGLNLYRKSFKNFPQAIFNRAIGKYPINVELRKQSLSISVEDKNQFYMAGYLGSFEQHNTGKMEITFLPSEKAFLVKSIFGRNVTVRHALDDGDFPGVFFSEEYKELDVKDKTVIDVGASIGDTALYFYLFGAKQIFAYEPTLRAFGFASQNIDANNLVGVVSLFNQAVSTHNSTIYIEDNRGITGGSPIKYSKNGREVETVSFLDILKQIHDKDIVLKMDCEGCEYEIFDSLNKDDLKDISQIALEYHNGPERLLSLLKKSGFITDITKQKGDIGIIVAKRRPILLDS